MKKIIVISTFFFFGLFLTAQVGIGVQNPLSRLHVNDKTMADSIFIGSSLGHRIGVFNSNSDAGILGTNTLQLGTSPSSAYIPGYIGYQVASDALDIFGHRVNNLKPRSIEFYAKGGTIFNGDVMVEGLTVANSINATDGINTERLVLYEPSATDKWTINSISGAPTLKMLLNGNLGFYRSNPIHKLDVNGMLNIQGTFLTDYLNVNDGNSDKRAIIENIFFNSRDYSLEFGHGVTKYEINSINHRAGQWYHTCQPNSSVKVFGAGTNINNLKTKFWAENRTYITNNIIVEGDLICDSLLIRNTSTQAMKVGTNGSLIKNVRGGTITVGQGNINSLKKTGQIDFGVTFEDIPKLLLTVRNNGSLMDQFVVSAFNIDNASAQYAIKRIDITSVPPGQPGWGQTLLLDWWIIE